MIEIDNRLPEGTVRGILAEIEREEPEKVENDVPRVSDLENEMREQRASEWDETGGAPSSRDAITEHERRRDG